MSYFRADDVGDLEAWAQWLSATSVTTASRANDLAAVHDLAAQAGSGSAIDNLQGSVADMQTRLRTASGELGRGASVLHTLIYKLQQLESEAHTRFVQYGSPREGSAGYVHWEVFGDPHLEFNSAAAARGAAAADLRAIANAAPGHHPKSAWQRFVSDVEGVGRGAAHAAEAVEHDVAHVGKDVADDVWSEVKGIAQLGLGLAKFSYETSVFNMAVNPKGWLNAWEGAARTAVYVVTHPMEVGSQIVDGIVDRQMFDKDKAAWAITLVVNILGAKGLGKLANAGRAGDAAASSGREAGLLGRASTAETIARQAQSGSLKLWDPRGHVQEYHLLPPGSTDRVRFLTHQIMTWDKTYPRAYGGVFYSDQVAESAMRQTLTVKSDEIANWLNQSAVGQRRVFILDTGQDVGTAMSAVDGGGLSWHETSVVQLVLQNDPAFPGGFNIVTMFPKY